LTLKKIRASPALSAALTSTTTSAGTARTASGIAATSSVGASACGPAGESPDPRHAAANISMAAVEIDKQAFEYRRARGLVEVFPRWPAGSVRTSSARPVFSPAFAYRKRL
jgi:hypothetical protein